MVQSNIHKTLYSYIASLNYLSNIEDRVWAKEEIKRIDALRGENFMDTFPELGALYKVPESLRP